MRKLIVCVFILVTLTTPCFAYVGLPTVDNKIEADLFQLGSDASMNMSYYSEVAIARGKNNFICLTYTLTSFGKSALGYLSEKELDDFFKSAVNYANGVYERLGLKDRIDAVAVGYFDENWKPTAFYSKRYTGSVAVSFPSPQGCVNDFASVLSSTEEAELNSLIIALEKKTSTEIVIVTIDSVKPLDSRAYTAELFNKWAIGKKEKDNGLLLLWAKNERNIEIRIDYGSDGMMTNIFGSEVLDHHAAHYFQNEQIAEGFYYGISALAMHITSLKTAAVIIVMNDDASVWPTPTCISQNIGTVKSGETYVVLGENVDPLIGTRYEIHTADDRNGWVSAIYVKKHPK